jgi:hypothetical protein
VILPFEYSAIYKDGSKNGDRVGSAAVFGQQVYSARLPSVSSIISAEADLKFVASFDTSKFMICFYWRWKPKYPVLPAF